MQARRYRFLVMNLFCYLFTYFVKSFTLCKRGVYLAYSGFFDGPFLIARKVFVIFMFVQGPALALYAKTNHFVARDFVGLCYLVHFSAMFTQSHLRLMYFMPAISWFS